MSTTTTRSRTVTWEDPLPPVERGMSMSGIDYLRAMEDDERDLVGHGPILAGRARGRQGPGPSLKA